MTLDRQRRLDMRQRWLLVAAGVMVLALAAVLPVVLSDPDERAARLHDQELRSQGAAQWSAYAAFVDLRAEGWPQPGDLPPNPVAPADKGKIVYTTGGPAAASAEALGAFLGHVSDERYDEAEAMARKGEVEPVPRGLEMTMEQWGEPGVKVCRPGGDCLYTPYWTLSKDPPKGNAL